MRRWNSYQNRNQNGTLGNHFNSNDESSESASPDIVVGQMWLQDDTTQVEIIELDSDDVEVAASEKQDYNFGQYWHYVDKDRFSMPEPEIYKMNRKAREKRRLMQNSHYSNAGDSPENLENEVAEVVNDIVYSSFYGSTNDISDNKKNHQANCFTIINKSFSSDSSSEETEFIDRRDTSEHVNGDMPYNGEIITLNQNVDSSKRTIWIYSFRNKRLLSDNDFELVNIPSQDSTSSTSCSLENFCEELNASQNTARVASPIPATYVPRLNLSMATTLPTVTEITEPTRNTPDEIPKSVNSTNRHKSINNWCDEKITNGFLKHVDKQDKSSNTNVINWMSLSPRERRQRSRHTKFSPTYQSKLPVLVEVPSTDLKSNYSLNKDAHQIQTTAEINTLDKESNIKETVLSRRNLPRSGKRNNLIVSDVNDAELEKGDFDKQLLQKPQITIDMGRPKFAVITDPIEKLDSNNWIHEVKKQVSDTSESVIQELENSSGRRDTKSNVCASNKLWARNMSLLKPVAWSEFLPITESVPSLRLSIASDSGKQSWLKRLAKCFRCLK